MRASEFQAGIGGALVDPTRAFAWVDDIVLVFDESGTLVERLLHGPQVDQVLASEDASGDVQWFLGDHLGTIRDVVEYDSGTDSTTVVNHLQYSSFGQITSQTSSVNEPRYAFTGRKWDADADLYYYRARWYDPTVGRFISEDPIGFAAGDVNVSRYVANSQTKTGDPTGLDEPNPSEDIVRRLMEKNVLIVFDKDDERNATTAFAYAAQNFPHSAPAATWQELVEDVAAHVEDHGLLDHLVILDHGLSDPKDPTKVVPTFGDRPDGEEYRIFDPGTYAVLAQYMEEDALLVLASCNIGRNATYCKKVASAIDRTVLAPSSTVLITRPGFELPPEAITNIMTRGEWVPYTNVPHGE
ncbi:MAG: hypothetical protein Fues2KO_41720 [Fuerstiella sp.]